MLQFNTGGWSDFKWERPDGWEYQWVKIEESDTAQCYLDFKSPMPWVTYSPLAEHPDLFLEFSRLPLSDNFQEQSKAFANKYGALGIKGPFPHFIAPVLKEHYEWDTEWRKEAEAVSDCVELWTLIERHETQTLTKQMQISNGWVVFWPKRSFQSFPFGPPAYVANKDAVPARFAQFLTNDIYRPARFALEGMMNQKLSERPTDIYLIDSMSRQELVLRIGPKSLIGGLWLQLAAAITADSKPALCQNCGEVFVPQRSTKKYCDDNCRLRAHRKNFV